VCPPNKTITPLQPLWWRACATAFAAFATFNTLGSMAIATIGHIFRSRTPKVLEIVAVMVLSERESLAENNNNN
jgi:hypothetical protein